MADIHGNALFYSQPTHSSAESCNGIRMSRTSGRREHPLVSPPVRAMTGRGGGWGCPKRTTRTPNLMLFIKHIFSSNLLVEKYARGNSEFQLRIKLLSEGGVETLIVVEQHKRVGVNPAKREEGEYLRSNKTSTAHLQTNLDNFHLYFVTFRFVDFLIPIFKLLVFTTLKHVLRNLKSSDLVLKFVAIDKLCKLFSKEFKTKIFHSSTLPIVLLKIAKCIFLSCNVYFPTFSNVFS